MRERIRTDFCHHSHCSSIQLLEFSQENIDVLLKLQINLYQEALLRQIHFYKLQPLG